MPGIYTRDEKVDMLLIFGECQKNAVAAEILYRQRYPNRLCPARNYFQRVEALFRREPNNEPEEQFIVNQETEINVLARVEIDRTVSLRQIAFELDLSRESVRRILKKHKYRSYKYQINQHLYPNDSERRIEYCNWILRNNAIAPNNEFLATILFSDESRFTNLGLFNRQNTRYWAQENRHLFREGHAQDRFGFNVWLGLIGTRIIGPIIFDGPLNGDRYLEFLQNEIEESLEELPLNLDQELFFQQDGAPPHNAMIVGKKKKKNRRRGGEQQEGEKEEDEEEEEEWEEGEEEEEEVISRYTKEINLLSLDQDKYSSSLCFHRY